MKQKDIPSHGEVGGIAIQDAGVIAENGGQVTVLKYVVGNTGAMAKGEGSQITIQGVITGNLHKTYFKTGYEEKPEFWGAFKNRNTEYLVYTGGNATVSVKAPINVSERNCVIRKGTYYILYK